MARGWAGWFENREKKKKVEGRKSERWMLKRREGGKKAGREVERRGTEGWREGETERASREHMEGESDGEMLSIHWR